MATGTNTTVEHLTITYRTTAIGGTATVGLWRRSRTVGGESRGLRLVALALAKDAAHLIHVSILKPFCPREGGPGLQGWMDAFGAVIDMPPPIFAHSHAATDYSFSWRTFDS